MMTIRESTLEPAIINRIPRREAVQRMEVLLDRVHPRPEALPDEFSGGQRQRIAIARAPMLSPKMLVLDEPVSSPDLSIQAEVPKLLRELQRDLGPSYLFASHDLSVVAEIAHKVVVMHRIVERGAMRELFGNPRHPYTRALISAVPVPDPAIERHRKRQVFNGTATNIVMDADRPNATPR
ncbi:MAG: hypothetical protein DI556_21850 [Rhodovulum sulfidophilum]|uniref:ABC transporter domain-containing protein n=1 Tax=Rhodovulum sulfidophilum TaxID=35806 RepID=A0A2W5PMK8_RHOSU|nr:MAG: hypothetical protein DI556_21850 [Rhodovulum sulfidophilum]